MSGTDFMEAEPETTLAGTELWKGFAVPPSRLVSMVDEPKRKKRPLGVARRLAAALQSPPARDDGRTAVAPKKQGRAIPRWMHLASKRLDAGEDGVVLCRSMHHGRQVLRELYEGLAPERPGWQMTRGGLRLVTGDGIRLDVVNHRNIQGLRCWALLGTAVTGEAHELARARFEPLIEIYDGEER